jgi:alpha-glucosidase
MRICSRPAAPSTFSRQRLVRWAFLAAALVLCGPAHAQTLARPGWAGSGLSSQSWWQDAVIYRVQPELFQDSDGDGTGDLRGLAERLDYLQSLGIDAVLIESHSDDPGFDDLLSDASRHHIRILVELSGDAAHPLSSAQALAEARSWLRRGVAGVYVPSALLNSLTQQAGAQNTVSLLAQLRSLADSFPGERIVISGNSPAADAAAANAPRSGPEMVAGSVDTSSWNAAALRTALALADSPTAGEPLLEIAPHSEPQPARDKILAALFLSARGAVSLQYGQEIGLPSLNGVARMRWTPSNVTPPHPAAENKPKQEVYGTYHPYVRPPSSSVMGSRPGLPSVALNTESAPPPVDPNTLPGFSTRPMPGASSWDATINVAVEDDHPDSLLNFYRRVLELHAGNATLRNGALTFLNHDSDDAVVWLRRAPAGARTVASVIVVCNLADHAITLSLDGDLQHLHLGSGWLHPLLTSLHVDHLAQSTGSVHLSPHSVYIAELHHR